jgi:ubiquinone/menaquinone biosynthesis C-methylase UbiE
LTAYFTEQARRPHGLFGKLITTTWSTYFGKLSDWTLDNTRLENGEKILEIGYGGGVTLKNLVARAQNFEIDGLDISESALQRASRVNARAIKTGQLNLSVGSVETLPYENGKFDTVLAVQTHIFWSDLTKALTEIYRVLSDEGQLVISCEKERIAYHLEKYQNSDLFAQLLRKVGFHEVVIHEHGTWICYQAFKIIKS